MCWPFWDVGPPNNNKKNDLWQFVGPRHEHLVQRLGGVRLIRQGRVDDDPTPVSYTHLRAHETSLHLVCRLLLEKKKEQ